MSIFKRGKHAKDEVPGSSYGSVPLALSPETLQGIAAGVSSVGSLAPEIPVTFGLDTDNTFDPQENAYPGDFIDASEPVSPFEEELDKVLGEIKELLLEKNASYGDSALNPVRIMSDADAAEQIRIRMDDKLSRLYRGFAFEDTETGNPEDTLKDLVGYYFLLKIAEARHA